MTISDGNTILAADLNGGYPSFNVNAAHRMANQFRVGFIALDIDSVSNLEERQFSFVSPDDYILAEVDGYWYESPGPTYSDTSLSISGPLVAPINLSVDTSTGMLERYYSDDSRPLQVFLKGATYTITIETAFAGGGGNTLFKFGLNFKSDLRRE